MMYWTTAFMAATGTSTGPLSSAKTYLTTEFKAGAAIVIGAVILWLLIQKKMSAMFAYIVLAGIAGLFIFSFDTTQTWLSGLFKSIFGIT